MQRWFQMKIKIVSHFDYTAMLYEYISHPTMGGYRSDKVGFHVKNLNQKVPTGDDIPPIFVRLRQRLGRFWLD